MEPRHTQAKPRGADQNGAERSNQHQSNPLDGNQHCSDHRLTQPRTAHTPSPEATSKDSTMKKAGASNKTITTQRWSQKLQIKTRWTDANQRILLFKQSAQFVDENHAKGIVASDIHQHLGVHAKKVNDIFQRFYGVSASIYLRDFKCKVLFAKIQMAPIIPLEEHVKSAGMTGSPGEKRAFKTLHGISVEEHWNQSKAEPAADQQRGTPSSLPSALAEAEEIIETLMATITESKAP